MSDEVPANLDLELEPAPKLPNMNEFSPGVIEGVSIRELLLALQPMEGDPDAMRDYLAVSVPKIAKTSDPKQRATRARNVLIGMSQCGLLEKDGNRISGGFTDVSKALLALPTNDDASRAFAAHLIEKCHGSDLIDVTRSIRSRGDEPSLDEIRAELRSRGFEVTENEGNASKIRMWLEHAGVTDDDWNFNDAALASVIGATSSTLTKWNALSRAQRVFLAQVREQTAASPPEWHSVRVIKRHCESRYGRSVFPEGRLRADVIDPLVEGGWIETQGIGSGRGGDSADVRATSQLVDVKIKLPLDATSSIPHDLLDKLGTPTEDIFTDIYSTDTYKAGLALELLALRIVRDLNLFPDGFRERSSKTGGAEVDLIANGVHLHFSRWLVQCKRSDLVTVSAIAKEAGMAVVLRAQVILLVSTGAFAQSVAAFAKRLARTSTLQAALIDGTVLAEYRSRGVAAIVDHLDRNARQVLRLKRDQVHEEVDD
jgi:hypothetical protein